MPFSEGESLGAQIFVSVHGTFLSRGQGHSREMASKWLPRNLLGRHTVWARTEPSPLWLVPLEQIALYTRPSYCFSHTCGTWLGGRYSRQAVLRQLSICLQTLKIGGGHKGKTKKNVSGGPQPGVVIALRFKLLAKRPCVGSGTHPWHFSGKRAWVLTCPAALCTQSTGREGEPAGWQRNVLGMNCILMLTLPQAVLPDGRKIERSQL